MLQGCTSGVHLLALRTSLRLFSGQLCLTESPLLLKLWIVLQCSRLLPTVFFFLKETKYVGGFKAQRLCRVPPEARAVTVIMLLRSYFHWKSWDHSVTLTLALDFFKWYWFRKSGFGFDGVAEVRGWLNMSSSVRLFSCPDQSRWLLWPSQDVFSSLSCGLRTFFCRVNNKADTNQSLQTLVKYFPHLYICTLHSLQLKCPLPWLLNCGSICFVL